MDWKPGKLENLGDPTIVRVKHSRHGLLRSVFRGSSILEDAVLAEVKIPGNTWDAILMAWHRQG